MTKANEALNKIPVVVGGAKLTQKLHWQRRAFQLLVIALLVLIPMTGLFRIDPIQGAFVVLGRQIWFSDFSIVFGIWIVIACFMVLLYSVAGTVFCGWACPQNTLSEITNQLTYKLLGKRADINIDGTPMQVASSKNKWLNWVILTVFCALVSGLMALIPLFYFYSPDVIWAFVSFQHDSRLAPSLHWIYSIVFLVIFVDVLMIRHYMCRFMCIYKVWQHTFKTKETLHIAYDTKRSSECERCSYCVTSCFLGIDPRKTDMYDTCVNCGECITACNNLHARKGEGSSLLSFAMGERDRAKQRVNVGTSGLLGRMGWVFPLLVIGFVMFFWGLWSYERYHISAYRADTLQGNHIQDYRISVANKFYEPAEVKLEIEGLPDGSYTIDTNNVIFETAGRINVNFSISLDLPNGLYPFLVKASVEGDHWEETFRVHHVASAGEK